ncbi:unnamed protein product [Miscanthus lutarioriparius]|uniref:Uncharacterized protein n=1 Tax=Miscanthus lutarioriparius TaxID=422564 RepID=A0A811SJX7_9POAL|nr:unnamed protein product [Miscanthus lutarioriparius]
MAASSSFKPNPLSLSVPDPALDRWLRDSGYLDLLDSTTTGGPSSASAPSTSTSTSSSAASPAAGPASSSVAADVLAFARTLASLLALNPFARLSTADLAAPTPSWSLAFVRPPAPRPTPGRPHPPWPGSASRRTSAVTGCRWRCWGCWPASPSGRACATAGTIGASPPGLQGLPKLCCTVHRLVSMMFLPAQHLD